MTQAQVSQSPGRPLLSFAVPTYNRAKYLDQVLGVLLKQLHGESRVELIVSDNASTDNTPAVVEDYRQRGLDIRYLRNEANRGADFNILQCFEQSRGKYVWVCGDDDFIVPGTLKRVLDALASQLYDFVCIRAFPTKGKDVLHENFIHSPDIEVTSAECLARYLNVFITFISGIIVNKEYISSVEHRPFDSLLGTNFVQLGPYYTLLNNHRRSLLIRDPLIASTSNTCVGYALFYSFGPALTKITCEWIENKSIQRPIINGTILRFFPVWILKDRISQVSSAVEDAHQVLCPCFTNNFRYWVFLYPVYALPLPLARVWLLMVRVLNKVDKALGSPLLR